MDLKCDHCGTRITYSGHGRPPTRFCSRKCKEAARTREQHDLAVAARTGRRCLSCGGVIPAEMTGKAKYCSRNCGITGQNQKRADATRAAWRARGLRCARCGEPIPIPDAGPHRVKYCSAVCKKKDADARWRASAPHYNRQYLYGMTAEEFDARLAAQGGVCAICGTPEWNGKGDHPHVDHCHETSQVRGLLCRGCNNGLGNFGDDPARLRAAADYLEAHSARP